MDMIHCFMEYSFAMESFRDRNTGESLASPGEKPLINKRTGKLSASISFFKNTIFSVSNNPPKLECLNFPGNTLVAQ